MAKKHNPNDETQVQSSSEKENKDIPVKRAPLKAMKDFRRGSETKIHRLFKLTISSFKRNTSWKYRKPDIHTVEHVHFFHSINDTTLMDNTKSSPVGGHWHDCHVEYNDAGEVLGVKVGPPMRKFHRVLPNGEYVQGTEQVSFEEYNTSGQIKNILDEHTHDIEYLGYEEFTRDSRNAYRAQNRRDVAQNVDGPVNTQASKLEALHTGADKDEVRHHISETAPKA